MQQAPKYASKFLFSVALKACAQNGSLLQGRVTHDQVIRSGKDAHVVVSTAIVDMYAKCGSFEEACKTFDIYPHRDLVSWNAIISACIDHGSALLALDFFRKMQLCGGFSPNQVSFMLVLKACGVEAIVWHGRLIHDHIIRSGIVIGEVCGSSLIDMYAKCGDMDDACTSFKTLPCKNVFSWGALMAGYVQHGLGFDALDLFEKMQQHGVKPNPAIFSCVLKACGSVGELQKGKLLHNQIMEDGFGSDPVTSNALMDMYAKCGELEEACKVLHKLPNQNERSWGAVIGGYIQQGFSLQALELFEKMQRKRIKPNQVIYSCVLKACGDVGATKEGRSLHEQILMESIESDVAICNSLIDMYASFGSLVEARKMFDSFPKVNTGSCEAMIVGYTKHGHDADALQLFEKVQHDGIKPSEAIFSCAVKACGGLKAVVQGRSVHAHIIIDLYIPGVVVVNSLIDMYINCGSLEEARKVFDISPNRDVVSWNSIFGGYIQNGHGFSALDLFNKMLESNMKPDRVTFLSMIKACSSTGALRPGRVMYEEIVESGFESDVAVRISLVDMFARCGSLQEARKLLDGAARSDIGAWAAVIAGYAQQGECGLARDCFHDLQKHGLNPDTAAFTVILAACCHAGEVEEGYWFFNAMKDKYGITPRIEHFNCLIDLLGRAGRLSEASQLLKIMPDFPDVLGWMSLLTACKKFGDAKLGKKCVEEILNIDPDNSAVYTLLSNTYADSHMLDHAVGLEELRSCANAWKKPPTAWIQVEDKLHEFMLRERDWAQKNDGDLRLKFLKQQIKEEGYIPKLDTISEEKPVDSSDSAFELNKGAEHASNFFEGLENIVDAYTQKSLVPVGQSQSIKGASLRFARSFTVCASRKVEITSLPKVLKREMALKDIYWTYQSSLHLFNSSF